MKIFRALVGALLALSVIPQAARAEANLVGYWLPIFHEDQLERGPGPDPGEYQGMPINDNMRYHANAWDTSILSLPEHQCKPHPSTYGTRGIGQLRIVENRDTRTQQQVSFQTHIGWMEQRRTIWMDGREHPPAYAPHTWQGFSTGRWEGDVLVVRTTHLKPHWIRRNGVFLTDEATMTERFIRHGNYMTHVMMIEDPHYLTEPFVRTNGFQLIPNGTMEPYPCRHVVEIPRAAGEVPSYIPETNTASEDFAKAHNLPVEAVRGGAATMYPEFMYALPARR